MGLESRSRPLAGLNLFHQSIHLIWLLLAIISLVNATHKIENYTSVKCADVICKDSFAEGLTQATYSSPHKYLLSFMPKKELKIFGKTNDEQFYFVQLAKNRGFVPANLIKLTKEDSGKQFSEVEISQLMTRRSFLDSSIEPQANMEKSSTETPSLKQSESVEHPYPVTDSPPIGPTDSVDRFTVIDGTTIMFDLPIEASVASPMHEASKTATVEATFPQSEIVKQMPVSSVEPEKTAENQSTSALDETLVDANITSAEDLSTEIADNSPEENKVDSSQKEEEKVEEVAESEKSETIVEPEKEPESITTEEVKPEEKEKPKVEETPVDSLKAVESNKTSEEPVQSITPVPSEPEQPNAATTEVPLTESDNKSLSNDPPAEDTLVGSEQVPVDSNPASKVEETITTPSPVELPVEPVKASDPSPSLDSNPSVEINSLPPKSLDTNPQASLNPGVDASHLPPLAANPSVDHLPPPLHNSPPSSNPSVDASHHPPPNPSIDHPPVSNPHQNPTPAPDPTPIDNGVHNPSGRYHNPTPPPYSNPPPTDNLPQQPYHNPTPAPNPGHRQKPFLNPTVAPDVPSQPPPHHHPTPEVPPLHQQPYQTTPSPDVPLHQHYHQGAMPSPSHQHDEFDSKNSIEQQPHYNPKLSAITSASVEEKVEQVEPDSTINDSYEQQQQQPSSVPPAILSESASMVNQNDYTGNNMSKRKMLAEKVAFVSVIMEIIPDEVELFFENFNISLHAVVFTSIVAFFWCLMKVFVFFISSSKKERELRDTNCQSQRKLYYIEAEKEKQREEINFIKDKLFNHEQELRLAEKRKLHLEKENEKFKAELLLLKKENDILKTTAESTPQLASKLETTLTDQEKFKQENRELVFKIEDLEEQIETYKDSVNNLQELNKSDKDEIEHLNKKLETLTDENTELTETLKESKLNFEIVHNENMSLKERQNKLSEEVRDLKDELLLLKEKTNELADEKSCLELELNVGKSKIESMGKELETKQSEIVSMQTLLNKLNKTRRRQSSIDVNGDVVDVINGDETNADSLNNNLLERSSTSSLIEEEGDTDLQDVMKLQLKLTQVELERDQAKEKYETVQKTVDDAKSQVVKFKAESERLKEETEEAVKKQNNAVMELEILRKYYKEKELEYAKDIGVHWLKREQTEEDASSLTSKLEVVQEENDLLKKQLKSTKKELDETERRYKSQLNQLEKQSHENWIAARNAERKCEESKAEATALRQTLTLSVKSPPPLDHSLSGYLDDTASSVSSLPEALNASFQLPPPPPPPPPFMPFMPPPIGPLPPGPPPLFDPSDTTAHAGYWNSPPVNVSSGSASIPTVTSNYPKDPMAQPDYSQTNHPGYSQAPAYPQPQAQHPPPANPYQYSSQPQQQQQQQQQQQPQSQQYNQWMDVNRNTYSPMSQRSATATPHTSSMPTMPLTSNPVPASYSQQYSQPQQQNMYQNVNTATYPNYTQQSYSQQQSYMPPTSQTANTQQIWTAPGLQQQQPPPQSSNMPYQSQPNNNNNYMPSTDSNSRPASVHTQMV